jgi:hypothetical protein
LRVHKEYLIRSIWLFVENLLITEATEENGEFSKKISLEVSGFLLKMFLTTEVTEENGEDFSVLIRQANH